MSSGSGLAYSRYGLRNCTCVRSSSRTPAVSPGDSHTPTKPPSCPDSDKARMKKKGQRHPPSRRLVRHVLQARVKAAKVLATMFALLEGSTKDIPVCASSTWPARAVASSNSRTAFTTSWSSGVSRNRDRQFGCYPRC